MGESLKSGGANALGSSSIALPGQKLVTSKNPRMLTQSEIELLRQDLRAALEVVGPDEIEDARSLLRENRFSDADFEILQRSDLVPSFPSPITGFVFVFRTSNALVKAYQAGSGSSWLTELERDLKLGVFGSPSKALPTAETD
jgi:hypothetical protein